MRLALICLLGTSCLLWQAKDAQAGRRFWLRAPYFSIQVEHRPEVPPPTAAPRSIQPAPSYAPPVQSYPQRSYPTLVDPSSGHAAVEELPSLASPTPVPLPQPPPATFVGSHVDFARGFTPREGNYDVVLLHPCTRQPVRVCFSLPCGYPQKVRVERRELEFDYGEIEVEIDFKRNGQVEVEYND